MENNSISLDFFGTNVYLSESDAKADGLLLLTQVIFFKINHLKQNKFFDTSQSRKQVDFVYLQQMLPNSSTQLQRRGTSFA